MASIKVILRTKANSDGSFPLAIQVTKDRKSSIIHIGHSIKDSDWDATNQRVKKSHPNSARMNNLILKKKAEANDTLLDMETKGRDVSSGAIKRKIKPDGGASFFAQASVYLKNLETSGKYGRHTSETSRIKYFKEFLGGRDIAFSEITVNLLNQFRAWLKGNRGIGERTVMNYLLLIRTIYNQAIKSNVTDNKNYPFGRGKIVIKFPDSIKIGLTAEEVKTIEKLELTGYGDHCRNVWLVAFYYAGMRISDVLRLRWSDFRDGRLQYAMTKNLKVDSLKTPDKVLRILEKYKQEPQKHDFIFPELKVLDELKPYEVERKIRFASKRIGMALKEIVKDAGITKNISPHIARHTFGHIAGDKIPIQILQHLYRHSNISTTINYQGNFVHDKTDNALDTVLDF